MKRILLVLAGSLLLVAMGAIALAVMLRHPASGMGFIDVVKNPDYWQKSSRAEADADAAAAEAQGWDDEKVAAVVRDFVLVQKSSKDSGEGEILKKLGARTYPAVLALLKDRSLYAKLIEPTGENILPEAPLNRACDVLGDVPPAEAVEALAPFLDAAPVEIRKDAALAIGKTGSPAMVPAVKKALVDADVSVREYALMGLEWALNRKGIDEATGKDLYPAVLAVLHSGNNEDKAAGVLFGLDRGPATAFLTSDEALRPDSPIVAACLKTLANAQVPVTRERLLGLIQALESQKLDYPRNYALGDALRLLGQQKDAQDRDFIRQRTTSLVKEVAEGAAEGLMSSYGLDGFEQKLEEKEDRLGFDGLSPQQKVYSAVDECDGEINNGGLAQYFVNSSGDHWREALAGFEAMGMKERVAILKEAIAFFGSAGPSTNRDVREEQLAKLYRTNDKIFDALDDRYYDCKENVEVVSGRYVLENPDGFR